MAPSVKLHFFAANDVNGSLLHEITDEDDYFKSLKLKVERDGLGGAELLLARTVGFSPFADGTFRAESFVRLIIPAYSSTTYYPWGFFLNKRQQVVVHVDEKGGEEFKLGGPGPKQYLARHALGIETQTSQAPTVDLENGVWRWNEHATVGRILNKILDEDAALNNPSLPDLTWTFDNIDDSDSVNWIDDDIAGPGEFEVPIGTDFLKVLWDLDDFVQLTSWVDLGTVATPKFELNIIQGLGDDNTGSAFGAGVCLLKEGVNVADDAVTVEGASLRQASHVLVEGKDGVWVQAVRTGYSPGDYTKREKISFTRTSNEAWLEAVGKRWLDRQDNGEKEITIEIVPGQSDATGSYFPAPNRVLWLSNLISVETAADGTSQTALDLDPADAQLVTGFELDTHQAADDSDSTAYARSWDVKVKLNVERSGNVQKTPDQRSTASGGGHQQTPERSSLPLTPFDEHDLPHGYDLTKLGIVLERGGSGAWDEALVESPNIFWDPASGRYGMVYVGYAGSGYATANHGKVGVAWWDDADLTVPPTKDANNPIISGSGSGPDSEAISGPFLWFEDGTYYLFYIGMTDDSGYETGTKSLCLATTDDLTTPITWTRLGAIVEPAGTGWRQSEIYHPNMVKRNDRYYLFFNAKGSPSAKERIGLALAPKPGGPWTVDDANSPLIDVGGWAANTVGDPYVYRIGETWYMAVYGGPDGTIESQDRIYYTSDIDFPYNWTLADVDVLLPGPDSFDAFQAHKPAIWITPTTYYHFYTATNISGGSQNREIALAIESIGLTAATLQDAGHWEPVTNGDATTPEIVFNNGDVVMAWVEG